MTINFSDSNKFKTVYDIKTAQENGKDVFNNDEKTIFISVDKLDNAIKVAELLVRVKKALRTNVKDDDLTRKLEEQKMMNKGQGSFAWQTINKHDHYCQRVLNRLHKLAIPSENVPTDKTERKNKIDELKVEQSRKKSKMAEGSDRQITYNRQLMNLLTEKRAADKKYHTSFNLIAVLRGDMNGEIINVNGQREKLSSLSDSAGNKTIKDYAGNNVSKPDSGSGCIGTGTGNEKTDSLVNLITYANTFLDLIPTYETTHVATGPTYIEAKSLTTEFNSRRINCKQALTNYPPDIGFQFWKVLNDIGADNLKKAIKKSGLSSSDQTKMGEYAEELTKWVSDTHQISGDPDPDTDVWVASYDKWQPGLLKRGYDVFPHVLIPNYEHMFEFMKKVFPPVINSSGIVTGLVAKDYLDKPDDPSYLKPSSGKKGWEGLTIHGFAARIPSGATETGLGRYVANNEGKPGFNGQLRGQLKPNKISDDLEFKSLVGLWWKIFAHHMNNSNPAIADYTWKCSDITSPENHQRKSLEQIRYARTMKAILKAFNIASGDEFDEYLLKIVDEVDKKHFISPRDKIVERGKAVYEQKKIGNKKLTVREAVKEKLVWGGDYEWENVVDQLVSIIDISEGEVLRIESDIDQVRKQISGISGDNATLQLEIDVLEDHIKLLQSLDEDEGNSLDKNKTDFQTLYDEKSKQANKWSRNQLRRMRSLLGLIKTKINDDAAFEDEFKDKQKEIDDKIEEFGKHDSALKLIFYTIKQDECNDSLTETIKKIIKEGKDDIGTSLEDIAKEFEELDKIIKIDAVEKTTWDTINEAITSPGKYKDQPKAPKVTADQLKTAFGDIAAEVATQELADKWGNAGVTKEEITRIIGLVVGSDKKTPNTVFISHLKKDGLDDGTKLNKDGDELWKEFLANEPERVAKTIFTHHLETDDNKGAVEKEMKEKVKDGTSGDTEEKLDMTSYGSTSKDGEPNKPGMVKYLWQKAKGGSEFSFYKVKEKDEEGGGSDTQNGETKSWFVPSKDNIWRPVLTYTGIFLLIVGVLAVIFWQNISEWWNGPAEEPGKGETEEGEKEEEEDK